MPELILLIFNDWTRDIHVVVVGTLACVLDSIDRIDTDEVRGQEVGIGGGACFDGRDRDDGIAVVVCLASCRICICIGIGIGRSLNRRFCVVQANSLQGQAQRAVAGFRGQG